MAKEKKEEKPRVHKDLEGFDIKINSFGEIQMSYDVEKINQFLNKNVEDKKLKGVEDQLDISDEDEKS
ncbi:hypothetical protein SAMN06298216_1344 [Spirosomataceae bacterium TFI 002]|nr:hypothetical protein SAMN06298216_1344 [Spirosomataceae bacterium TFI 002]